MTWLERYRAGERDRVWAELRQLGASVRDDAHLDDATAVALEMASRARQNVELLVGRLEASGYTFHTNDAARTPVVPWTPPTADVDAHVAWLEFQAGPLPLTVVAWARTVGDVWLVGTHPAWDHAQEADPLVVEIEYSRHGGSPRDYLTDEFEQMRADGLELTVPVSPDRLHKANVSGGGPYGIAVPDASADGLLVGETTQPFVSYLNHVFSRGGFADAERAGGWMTCRSLAEDILPL